MATDAQVPFRDDRDGSIESDDALQVGVGRGRTGAAPVGGSVECASEAFAPAVTAMSTSTPDPETLYRTRIAVLEARVADLEATVARKERDLQHVIDNYERVLDARADHLDEPLANEPLANESLAEPGCRADGSGRPSAGRSRADVRTDGGKRSSDDDRSLIEKVRALIR